MFSFFTTTTATSKTSSSPAISPDSVAMRRNRHISDDDVLAAAQDTSAEGRTIAYETKIVYTPVKVSARPSSSDKALKTKRVVVTKQDMNELNGLLESMALNTTKSGTTPSKTPTTPTIEESKVGSFEDDDDDQDEQYGRYTESTRVGSSSQRVVRSRRIARY
mmetsp:Transcript_17835/g.48503  ORF Transcript_17835/g.48503 Transcript_17835/m.48503 type:complete len:163 (-) Transcript_17835:240-728(-)